jgi:hypothetical protein
MTTQVQSILSNFESLPEQDKRELASEIMRRNAALESPSLNDEQLTAISNVLFSDFDYEELKGCQIPR